MSPQPSPDADPDLLERLAALEHEQWAHWTKHLLWCLTPLFEEVLDSTEPGVEDAFAMVRQWQRQIVTPYADLPEGDKASDREWARKVLDVVDVEHWRAHVRAVDAICDQEGIPSRRADGSRILTEDRVLMALQRRGPAAVPSPEAHHAHTHDP